MKFSKPITDIIKQRISVRTYLQQPIAADKAAQLKKFIAAHSAGPFQSQIRFQLMTARPGDGDALKGLGTYGMIKNPAGFVVGAVESSEHDMLDFGYAMERLILFTTDLGLGTCWLGGSFARSRFTDAIGTGEQETVPAVTPVGHIPEKSGWRDSMVRTMAGSKKRLPWENLFFQEHFETPLSKQAAGSYATPLEMVRLGPSASNKQPWRIVKVPEQNTFHFYLKRDKLYTRAMKLLQYADLQRIDMGIALCHFELTAKEQGLSGAWEITEPGINSLPKDTEYVVSWKREEGK